MIINGNVYQGNLTILNGRVIGEKESDVFSTKDYDETKIEQADNIDKISIISDVDVELYSSNLDSIIAHLHGKVMSSNEIRFEVKKVGDEITILAKLVRSTASLNQISVASGNSITINNSSFINIGDLKLEIQIPKRIFREISVGSINTDIDVEDVNASSIAINSENGDVCLSAIFQFLNVDCRNGNIDIDSEAKSNIRLNVNSKNGDISVDIANLRSSEVLVNSKNGKTKNKPKLVGEYLASGYIKSKNGDVRFY